MTTNAYIPDPIVRAALDWPVDPETVILLFILAIIGIALWYYLIFGRICSEQKQQSNN